MAIRGTLHFSEQIAQHTKAIMLNASAIRNSMFAKSYGVLRILLHASNYIKRPEEKSLKHIDRSPKERYLLFSPNLFMYCF